MSSEPFTSRPAYESFTPYTIVLALWGVGILIALMRLVLNWQGFGDRALPMLLACFVPGGFLWALFAVPGMSRGSRTGSSDEAYAARRMNSAYRRGDHASGDYWATKLY